MCSRDDIKLSLKKYTFNAEGGTITITTEGTFWWINYVDSNDNMDIHNIDFQWIASGYRPRNDVFMSFYKFLKNCFTTNPVLTFLFFQ